MAVLLIPRIHDPYKLYLVVKVTNQAFQQYKIQYQLVLLKGRNNRPKQQQQKTGTQSSFKRAEIKKSEEFQDLKDDLVMGGMGGWLKGQAHSQQLGGSQKVQKPCPAKPVGKPPGSLGASSPGSAHYYLHTMLR